MGTIGQRTAETEDQRQTGLLREAKRARRKADAKSVGCVVGGIAVGLGAIFALVYLVTLAVRLGWGT